MSINDADYYTFHSVDRKTGLTTKSIDGEKATESASTIKSPVGALALAKAITMGHNPTEYSFRISDKEIPTRATTIFKTADVLTSEPSIIRRTGGYTVPLSTLVKINIVNSDGMATKKLIEYLGGKDETNRKLAILGLKNTRLLTEVIDFEELATPDLSPRIGITSASDTANYYLGLEQGLSSMLGRKLAFDFLQLHSKVNRVRLFACSISAGTMPERLTFHHKTGVIFNQFRDGSGQEVIADAGLLDDSLTRKSLAAASFFGSIRPSLSRINTEFSKKNQQNLSINLDAKWPTDTRRRSPSVLVS